MGAPLALLLALLLLWELLVRLLGLPRYVLPAPSSIVETFWLRWPILLEHSLVTASEVLGGLVGGCLLAFLLAPLMFLWPLASRALYPWLVISQNVPVFALAPLLVVWFGYGYASKLAMTILIVFFPITVSLLDGLRRTDTTRLHLMRSLGATRAQLFWKLHLPGAVPMWLSGMRLAAVYATVGAVIGEWVGAGAGLGYLMLSANAQLRVAEVFAAVLCLVPVGLLLLGGVTLLERWLLAWQRSE